MTDLTHSRSNDTLTSLETTLLSALLGEIAVAEAVKHERVDVTVMVHPGPVSVGLVLYADNRKVTSSLSTNIIRAARDPDHLRELLYNGVCALMNELLGRETTNAYRLRRERNALLKGE
jgi:hypothetical protein